MQDSIHMYMQQMAASSMNTDQRLNQLGDHLGFMSQQNMAMFQQNQTLMQQMNTNRSGSGDDSGGYRTLKPRKEITAITADNVQALMEELDQFEVDLGELGLHLQTEQAYRQLRAMCTGKARDVIDLEIVAGGKALKLDLDIAIAQNLGKPARDTCGAKLYRHMVDALEKSVRLTPDKRCEIAQNLYSEARMLGDTVSDAEVFLCKWRKARRLM